MGAWMTYCRYSGSSLTSRLSPTPICHRCFYDVWRPLLKTIQYAIRTSAQGRLSICPPDDSGALSPIDPKNP